MSNINVIKNTNKISKLFQNCDMKTNIYGAKQHINSYMNEFQDRVWDIEWDKVLPGSKVLFEYDKSNVVRYGIECSIYMKTLLMYGKYFVIFEFRHEADDLDVSDIDCGLGRDSVIDNFTFIEFDSYDDDIFMRETIKTHISVPDLCRYFINTNRDIDDIMSYIKTRCDYITTGGDECPY
jgi:hypothetical protein